MISIFVVILAMQLKSDFPNVRTRMHSNEWEKKKHDRNHHNALSKYSNKSELYSVFHQFHRLVFVAFSIILFYCEIYIPLKCMGSVARSLALFCKLEKCFILLLVFVIKFRNKSKTIGFCCMFGRQKHSQSKGSKKEEFWFCKQIAKFLFALSIELNRHGMEWNGIELHPNSIYFHI